MPLSLSFYEGTVDDLPAGTERLSARGDEWCTILPSYTGRRGGWLGSGDPPAIARERVRAAARSNPRQHVLVMWAPNDVGSIQLGIVRSRDSSLCSFGVINLPEWMQQLEEAHKAKVSSFWSRLGGVDIEDA